MTCRHDHEADDSDGRTRSEPRAARRENVINHV
jgi:hypothetical protein